MFSESFQYVPIKKSLEKCYKLLNSNGYILICDFFQKDPSHFTELRGGHSFPRFQNVIQSLKFKEISNIDVTEQTAPTIQILDTANYPEKRYQPKRTLMVVGYSIIMLCLSIIYVILFTYHQHSSIVD